MSAAPSNEELAGRDSETARLRDAVRALTAGRGGVVEIAGDPGTGKTSLLGVLAAQASQSGFKVLRTQAREDARQYQLFSDAWGDQPGVESVRERLEAELEAAQHADSGDMPLHFRASLQVRAILAEWAADSGGLLIVDDLHLCGEEPAKLVAQLVRTPVPGPFLLAVAHRPRVTRPELLAALTHGVQMGSTVHIEPSLLDAEAVSALLARWRAGNGSAADERGGVTSVSAGSHEQSDRAHAQELTAAAGGNPRNLRVLVAAGWHPDTWPDSPGEDRGGLLRAAAALIAELDALPPDVSTTVGAAAVLGDPFRPEDVATVSGLDLGPVLEALSVLARRDLVRPLVSGGRLAFRDPVLGHVAHERTDLSFRLSAHRSALELLTTRGASAAARARHAEHLLASGDTAALQVLAEGAEEAIAKAPASAARWLGLALAFLPDSDQMSPSRAALMLARCHAVTATGRLEDARALAHELLGNASDLPADLRLKAYAMCANIERLLGRNDEAEAMAQAAMDALPRPLPDPLPAGTADLTFRWGLARLRRGTYAQARAVVREIAEVTDRAGDGGCLGVWVLAAVGDAYLGRMDTAKAEVTRCARLVDGLPDASVTPPDVLALVGGAEVYLERFANASRHLRRGLMAMRGRAPHNAVTPLLVLSILDQWCGRLDQAEHSALEAERIARSIGADDAVGLAMTTRAGALLWARERRETAEIIALAEEGARSASPNVGLWGRSAVGLLAQMRLVSGDGSGCIRTLVELGGGESLPLIPPPLRAAQLAMLSTAALRCGDGDAAGRWAGEAESAAEQVGLPVQQAYVRRARAMLHMAAGDHDLAVELFEQAAEGFRQAGMPVQDALTLVAAARSVNTTLGQAKALAWLDTALAVSRNCGALRVCEEAVLAREALTAGAGSERPTVGVRQEKLSLLTEREREIARLAAAGKRSKEIAEQLFLSPRTVDVHLARIYRKLDVSSRAALASVVLQTPLEPGG